MEPIFGFMLYFVALVAVAVVASKRGLRTWLYVASCLAASPVIVVLVSQSGGGGTAAGLGAFLVPVAAIFVALSSNTDAQNAVSAGESTDYKKCPMCAEAVRKEAIKCKHCGSDLLGPTAAT